MSLYNDYVIIAPGVYSKNWLSVQEARRTLGHWPDSMKSTQICFLGWNEQMVLSIDSFF